MTRKLVALNWLFGAILLGLVCHLSQLDPEPPSEADPDGTKTLQFFIYVFTIGAAFSLAIGTGLRSRNSNACRVFIFHGYHTDTTPARTAAARAGARSAA